MFLENLFEESMFYSPDDESGAGSVENTEIPDETLPGAGQTEKIKVGDLEIDATNPEDVKKLANSYKEALAGLTKKSQELKQKTANPTPKVVESPKNENNQMVEELYKDHLSNKVNDLVLREKNRFKTELGEKFDEATEKAFDEYANGIKSLEINNIKGILKTGNLDNILGMSIVKAIKSTSLNNQASPNIPTPNDYEKQESLPNDPKGKGVAPIGGEIKEDTSYDPNFSRASAKSKAARAIQQGTGIR